MLRQKATVVLWLVFLLGFGNFALHKAVIETRHPLLSQVRWLGRTSLSLEFVLLLAALALVANGHPGWGWVYAGYSVLNGVAGWLILTRRI